MILKFGSRGDEVRQVQILLNGLMDPKPLIKADGNFGYKTEELLKAFQRSRGLEPDGKVGPKTRAALKLQEIAVERPNSPKSGKSWIDIAIAEIGVKENALPGEHNNRIVEYHKATTLKASDDETAWCSSFVNWVLLQAGDKGTGSALARSWLNWGKAIDTPQRGCIIVIKKKTPGYTATTGSTSGFHVGFYVSHSESAVKILGGNQSDQVKYSNFSLSGFDVKGYRVLA